MSPSKMIDAVNRLFERSEIFYTERPIDEDFMRALFKADGKKAGNPEFDPSLHDFCADNSFWLGCHDKNGDLIATVAARRIEADAFLESCRSYKLWYGDKLRFTETLEIVIDRFDRIPSGETAFLGAAWVRPDWRGRGLSWALTRLGYYAAIEKWRLDWLIALVFSGIAQARMPSVNYGFPRMDLFASNYRLLGFSRQMLFLLSMTQPEALALAATDYRFLMERPYLAIDSGFGDELRVKRRGRTDDVAAEAAPELRIAI